MGRKQRAVPFDMLQDAAPSQANLRERDIQNCKDRYPGPTSWNDGSKQLMCHIFWVFRTQKTSARSSKGEGGGPGSDSQQLCLKTKHARLVSRSHPDGEKCLGISDGLWFMDVYGRASATTIAVHAHESCVFVKLAPGVRCDALEAENTRIRCLVG